jgi:uncharacterized protein YbjT (DUF2867 family)
MAGEVVAVFSASARPGLAQVRQLRQAGFTVRAITRQTRLDPSLDNVEVVPADLNDPPSVVQACEGADVVFFTSPSFAEVSKAVDHIRGVGQAATAAGVRRVVYNTTSWHPDEPIGVPSMDHRCQMTSALRSTGVPLTVVRPSLFMDNLLTKWVKPYVVGRGEFSYPHNPDLEVSWICLDDVARLMIEVIKRDELLGETLDVGGPEVLRPGDVARILADVVGRPVVYRQITPREFGERMYEIFNSVTDLDRETYVSNLEKHYAFKNATNPFYVPMDDMLRRVPIALTPMREWVRQQNWSLDESEIVGSVSS